MDGIYPDQVTLEDARRWLAETAADVLVVGHTHIAFAATIFGGGLIANPGALLREPAEAQGVTAADREERALIYDPDTGKFMPGSARGGGTFGVLELPSTRFTVHRASDGAEVEVPRPTLGVRDDRPAVGGSR